MNFLNSMLGVASWGDVINQYLTANEWSWLRQLLSVLSTVLWVLLVLVGAAGSIYAIYVGVKMARAESAEQRDENKKRLINIIVSIVVVIVLVLFFNTFLPMILDGFGVFKDMSEPTDKGAGGSALATAARLFLHM